ncbi:helix-turn-helix domain-containing protein [Nesterenkonia alkaliphila]|uniref:Winged helix-turn-helix transcriptional regulator n=1 Tax=Nesterenkonia alkaliphila TaxID=1463631 RepID=A0A7K1UGX5_9MICC|nr:winged helix-turn-helix transcriptional regulator [Nesterenkonia alkaliphila]
MGIVSGMTIAPENIDPKIAANDLVSGEIRAWLSRRGLTQKDLASVLGLSAGSVSWRMKGKTLWAFSELVVVASWLNISIAQLLGEDLVNEKNPHPMGEGSLLGVARPGFEPGTSGL